MKTSMTSVLSGISLVMALPMTVMTYWAAAHVYEELAFIFFFATVLLLALGAKFAKEYRNYKEWLEGGDE